MAVQHLAGDILVLNAGSSSIKLSLFARGGGDGPERLLDGQFEGIGATPHATARNAHGDVLLDQHWPEGQGPTDHNQALAYLLPGLTAQHATWRPAAVGHRVVHGGSHFREPVLVTAVERRQMEELVPLAPLHQPHNLKGIDAVARLFPDVPQVACFDTSFHRDHPWVADTYGLPRSFYAEGVRHYGFHGLSYAYIVRAMRRLAPTVAAGRMVVAHLGNGASMCAIHDGRSMDSTMGFTPLDGLLMGTRCGQIDPAVLLYLLREKRMSLEALSDLLYYQSGLKGLSGLSSDMRNLLASSAPEARQAVDFFVYRVTCSAGALAAALGGIDGLVFTGGIGENSAEIRARVCRGLAWLGLEFDEAANNAGKRSIAAASSKISAWNVPTDEAHMIAIHVQEILQRLGG
jgi:acetate kinase